MLLLIITMPIQTSALYDETQVIIDRKLDVRFLWFLPLLPQRMFGDIDIVSVSFSENEQQPEMLFVTLTLRDLSTTPSQFDAGYTISWSYLNAYYIVVAHILPQGEKFFSLGSSIDSSNSFENWISCEGFFDTTLKCITFSLSKESIGNPYLLSTLDNIDATAFMRPYDLDTRQPGADIFKDFTHNAKQISSYTIKY